MTAFKETTVLKCPSQNSFESHLKSFPDLQAIALKCSCSFKWNVLDKKERTFILKVSGCSKHAQQNALIEVMKFLCEEGIEPALVISTKTEKSESEIKLLQMQNILNEVEIPT